MLECIRTEKQDPNSGLQTGIERSSRSKSSCRNMDIKKKIGSYLMATDVY
jgi:hypothetical protein